jgi:hypothetical protein
MARPRTEPTDDDEELEPDNRFDPRPLDDGSPGRIIATMVGIVGILLLGSLFWSALGALVGALGAATQSLPVSKPAVVLTLPPAATATALVVATALPTRALPTPTPAPTEQPTPAPTTEETQAGRAPWILLPQPAPGTQVKAGTVTIEARGRGDATITTIRLELDGVALPASLEQRSDTIWRGVATARVSAGGHAAKAVVVDELGRSGSFRWNFDASP